MKLYLAYGANTNLSHMKVRCPQAKYVCNITLNHHHLVFRGVADVIPVRGGRVECAMWLITPKDEEALDRFEGFPSFYVKKYVRVRIKDRWSRVMLYVMRNQKDRAQSEGYGSYVETLRAGYRDCGLPLTQIDRAQQRVKEWERAKGWTQRSEKFHPRWNKRPVEVAEEDLFTEDKEGENQSELAAEEFFRSLRNAY